VPLLLGTRTCQELKAKWRCLFNITQMADEGEIRRTCPEHIHPGTAVQVDSMQPMLKAPGTKRLKLKYDQPFSNFAFKSNLRRYILGCPCYWPGCAR